AGRWDTAQIATESNCWNEPLLGVYGGDFVGEDRQFVAAGRAGIEVSGKRPEQGDPPPRLFNAEGVSGVHQIRLDFPVEGIEEVLLDGEKVGALQVADHMGKPTFSMDIPRFGIKTVRIKKK